MRIMLPLAASLPMLFPAAPADAAAPPDPLFAGTGIIRLTIRGPVDAIVRQAARSTAPYDATLTLEGAAPETHPIKLSARGLTRRKRDVCTFPPLRVDFPQKPAATSLFKGQNGLKLVTHCQQPESFQRYVLLEYAAYRLYNMMTPASLRVRLAEITYAGDGQRPAARLGFLIEDVDDAARRNGLREARTGDAVDWRRLDPKAAARYALFQYMIGNLDWAMEAGPPGAGCCHNSKLVAADKAAITGLVPIPYDFDHAGLVDAPYATPPPEVPVASVRSRRYRGFCAHNDEAQAAAAEARAARGALDAVLGGIPQLDRRAGEKASAYQAGFFEDIATTDKVAAKLLKHCRQ